MKRNDGQRDKGDRNEEEQKEKSLNYDFLTLM